MAMVMKMISSMAILIIPLAFRAINVSAACSNGQCQLRDECSSNKDCAKGLYCLSCPVDFKGSRCVRSITSNPFKLLNNSLPLNKYAFLTTHNSFAIRGEPSHTGVPRITATNQEDNVTQQLNEPLMDTLKEIEAFMTANPSEIITLILEDHVKAPNGLSKMFNSSGLNKFWFPVSKMPKGGRDWPLVKDMVADNQRLIVFTSDQSKQESEGIAYQWNFMVENQFGNGGLKGNCTNRKESVPMNDKDKSLVLVNHFGTLPARGISCDYNSKGLMEMLDKCYTSAGNRWANFVAVDYYKRSDGGGAFEAVDKLNGEMLCGCSDVRACVEGSLTKCN
ncbi:PI-PLC X domain-containing protein At5g67130 [Linum perenne]